jgi:glycerol-3-phosphate dehydrogenase
MDKVCDALIIGGGINGCGIAADAATRGLNVILCESGDLAQGTSSQSSKLIHGGLRYLEQGHLGLVRKALQEREILFKICPHLIKPLPFFLPHCNEMRPFWLLRLGLFIYDHLAKTSVSKTKAFTRSEESPFFSPLKQGVNKGLCYFDAQTDDARLVITNAMQAAQYGAEILTRTPFIKTTRHHDSWISVLGSEKKTYQVKSKVLINATGPWVESLNKTMGITTPYKMSHIKGSHLILPKLYKGSHAYILQNDDKRIVFTIPYQKQYTLIGTTESNYEGDLAKVNVTHDEKIYLCEIINRYFKQSITLKDIFEDYSGVRPLIQRNDNKITETTRDYTLHLDSSEAPVLSVFSGKLTTYRKLASDSISLLSPFFPNLNPSITDTLPLPGSKMTSLEEYIKTQSVQYSWLPLPLFRRYAETYGSRLDVFLKNCHSLDSLGHHYGHGLYQKEIEYLKNYEWAKTAEDIVKRRTKLSLKLNKKEIIQLEKELSNLL